MWLLICCLYKEVYLQNVCPFDYMAIAGSGKVGPLTGYSTDYVNCLHLKEKNVRRKENTRETNKPQKEKRKLNIEKQDEIAKRNFKTNYSLSFSLFRLVIPLLFCCGYSSLAFSLFKFRLAIPSSNFVLQFRLRLRFSLVLVVA